MIFGSLNPYIFRKVELLILQGLLRCVTTPIDTPCSSGSKPPDEGQQ
jgi:hypothetical protein